MAEPDTVIEWASATLDLAEPVAVVLAAVLHHVHDDQDPDGIVAASWRPCPPAAIWCCPT